MQLHSLPRFRSRSRTRVGRGGKRGTTSGRGTKGQRSRAGRRIRPAVRDLIIRIPKRRGFGNKPKKPKPFALDLSRVAAAFGAGKATTVNRAALREIGLVPKRYEGEVKIVGSAELSAPLVFEEGIRASAGARAKIEHAGGNIEK